MEILNVQNLYPIIKGRSYKLRSRSDIKDIMIHHSGSTRLTVADLYKLHTDTLHKWATIGYHFYITKTGNIYQVNDILTVVNGCQDRNTRVIHICFEGDYQKDIILDYHKKCLDFIVKWLLDKKYSLNITWHAQYKNTYCPGKNMIQFIKEYIKLKNTQSQLIWPELE